MALGATTLEGHGDDIASNCDILAGFSHQNVCVVSSSCPTITVLLAVCLSIPLAPSETNGWNGDFAHSQHTQSLPAPPSSELCPRLFRHVRLFILPPLSQQPIPGVGYAQSKRGSMGDGSGSGNGQSGGRLTNGSGKPLASGSGGSNGLGSSSWWGGGWGAAAGVAAGASGGDAHGAGHGSVYGSRASNNSSGGASTGVMSRLSGLSGGGSSGRGSGGGPSALRVSGGAGTVEVCGSAGKVSGGAGDNGGKPRSGRYTRLARYGPGLGSGQGPATLQYKPPQARAYNLRSGASQFSASPLGLGGVGSNAASGDGCGLGAGSAGTAGLAPQRTNPGGAAGAKAPYGVVAGASSGGMQSYGSRRGSNAAVGVGVGLGGIGSSSNGFGGGGVGFGRHKYG